MTGAGGTLGGALASALARSVLVVAGRRHAPTPAGLPSVALDLDSEAAIEAALESARVDAVVHSAAIADVDLCEREPEAAHRANTVASGALARACARHDLALVALSTDLVFPSSPVAVSERDATGPVSAYGRSKLAGEQALLAAHPGAAVVRVALVIGLGHGPRATASEAIAWGLRAAQPLRLYVDQFRAPVDAASLADAIARILERGASGIFHLGGPERVSRHGLGLRVAALLGLPRGGIVAIRRAELPSLGPRPAEVCLDSTRARSELGWEPRTLDAMILDGRPVPDIIEPLP